MREIVSRTRLWLTQHEAKIYKVASFYLPIFTWFSLLVIAAALTIDFTDAYSYMLSVRHLFDSRFFFETKSPLIVALFAPPYLLFQAFGDMPSLSVYHVYIYLFHTLFLYATARWIKRFIPSLPIVLIMGVVAWNRLFIHFSPFSYADLLSALFVTLWFLASDIYPLQTRKGLIYRILLFALIAYGRIQTVVVPLGFFLIEVFGAQRNEIKSRLIRVTAICALSALLFFLLIDLYYAVGFGLDPISAFKKYLDEFGFYTSQVYQSYTQERELSYIHFVYLFKVMTPAGVIVFLIGFFNYWPLRTQFPLLAPLVGSIVYLLVLLVLGHKEARYLSQLIPVIAAIQCIAIAKLLEKSTLRASVALISLFVFILPELLHFTDSFYYKDLPQKTSDRIVKWSKSREIIFVRMFGTFYPKNHYFHWNELAYYSYFFSGEGAFGFHSNRPIVSKAWLTKWEAGLYPVPDNYMDLAPPGVTMVSLPGALPSVMAPPVMPPIYVLRWWPLDSEEAQQGPCDPRIKAHCVEVAKVFDGAEN